MRYTKILQIIVIASLFFTWASCGNQEDKTKNNKKATPDVEIHSISSSVVEVVKEDSLSDAEKQSAVGRPTVIDFYATWCPPCKKIAPLFEMLKCEYSDKIEFKSVDVDENIELTSKYKIEAMPTFVLLDSHGNEIQRIVGADAEALSKAVDSLVADSASSH